MKRICLSLALLAFAGGLAAQTLSEFKPKDQSYGLNKAKNAKRIYIASFDVNYQIYNEKQDYKQGGYQLGGGMKGDALTEVSVGLEGLDEATVQGITDKLYKDYLAQIEAKGLTIISPDEAARTGSYEGYTRMSGGTITMAEIPGVLSTSPTGFEFFIKGVDKDGKMKRGGFLGNEAMKFPKLSKDLDDAIIGAVDITVLFIQDQDAFKGGGAKLKVKTSLRVVGVESVIMTDDAKVKFKGQNSVTTVTSTVAFYHGKMGAGATTAYNGTLAKPLFISGVIEDEKITSSARGGMAQGTKTMYGTFYSVRNEKTKSARTVEVDPQRYSEGVYAAASKFLNHHTGEFLKALK